MSTGGEVSNKHPNLLTFVAFASEVGTCKSFLPDVMGSDLPPLLASVKVSHVFTYVKASSYICRVISPWKGVSSGSCSSPRI